MVTEYYLPFGYANGVLVLGIDALYINVYFNRHVFDFFVHRSNVV